MLIFGWGHVTTKKYGATLAFACPNCNNETYLNLSRHRKWFTLFFIPVIPYSTNHVLSCDVCAQGIVLKGQQAERAKQMNTLTQGYLNETITPTDYHAQADKIEVLA